MTERREVPMTIQKPLLLAAALTAAAGCAHRKPAVALHPEPAATVAAVAPAAPPLAPAAACASDDRCPSSQLCLSGRCAAITPSLAECSLARVHFDFDQDLLRPAEFPVLLRMARCIEASEPAHVLVAGGADERGTVEYNLALGEKRADAVRRYLANLGVSPQKLELVTYGKEMPLCTEHTEACWQQNRRAAIRPGVEPKDLSNFPKRDAVREGSAGGP
jgi:peptidoglycan-associated lipoprotein